MDLRIGRIPIQHTVRVGFRSVREEQLALRVELAVGDDELDLLVAGGQVQRVVASTRIELVANEVHARETRKDVDTRGAQCVIVEPQRGRLLRVRIGKWRRYDRSA